MVLDVASKVAEPPGRPERRRKWGAPGRRQGQGPALQGACRQAPCRPGPSSAMAGPGSAGPGGCLGREAPARARPVPSCDLHGQVQPAAILLWQWRWVSGHCHNNTPIIILLRPYSEKVLRDTFSLLQCRLTRPATGMGRAYNHSRCCRWVPYGPAWTAQPELRRSH